MKHSIIYTLTVLFVLPVLSVCQGQDLTRDKALEILKTKETVLFECINKVDSGIYTRAYIETVDKLIKAGYLIRGGSVKAFNPTNAHTEKLKQYIDSVDDKNICIIVGTEKVNNITGISKVDENQRLVQYTIKVYLTPMANFFPIDPKYDKLQNATFRLFDSGWKYDGKLAQ